MALPAINGLLDAELNQVFPSNTGTWNDLSGTTWANWNQWITKPSNPMTWLADIIDLGAVKTVNLKITTDANGLVAYDVYTSSTGAFAGEEALTTIAQGATGVASFTCQYIAVVVKVTQTQGLNTLNAVELKANDSRVNILLKDISTSTLTGTSSARQLVLPRTVSGIVDMIITPHQTSSPYTLDLYVSSTQTSTQLVPKIVSKSAAAPTVALTGLDNQPRDGVIDVAIWALPEQYMDGNNLTTR